MYYNIIQKPLRLCIIPQKCYYIYIFYFIIQYNYYIPIFLYFAKKSKCFKDVCYIFSEKTRGMRFYKATDTLQHRIASEQKSDRSPRGCTKSSVSSMIAFRNRANKLLGNREWEIGRNVLTAYFARLPRHKYAADRFSHKILMSLFYEYYFEKISELKGLLRFILYYKY